VADNHNYFVGKSSLLAHNTCFPGREQIAKLLNTTVEHFHRNIKGKIIAEVREQYGNAFRRLGARNPDIGISDAGNVVLRHPTSRQTIETNIPIDKFIQP
jgi:hypothetical protein